MLKERLIEFNLDSSRVEQLEKYKEMLLEKNKVMNLTAITESDEVDVKHFLDSLSIAKTDYLKGNKTLLDVGTGAGFPGLALKIYNPEVKVTLLDSLNKRIVFLREVIEELGLEEIDAIHARAEEAARGDLRESFDIVTSRAVANMRTLLEYDLPFVKVGGYLICMKGPEHKEELKEAKKAISILGGKLKEIIEVELPGDITHYLVIIEKIKSTSNKYPRAGGKPKSQPI
ncbi:16S rRNA (guanine527-N7)-methyltransferase [Peptoniphilus asaccharolyticus DSM 20463]|uniref:Ribosomal RNA small subunit methyltransferase G n=1 Tax=Peptoniphilus asaccharolyticus DSM 20463 TaxID=573058 RepID=A0A1W1V508_PEPAS|nr:16S rRNA (guanine(527)-N(7))-methyltransferase RsmG [Peptoniphilus asaccharolyticus]MBL7576281.1 16S rRNA (guanine(527)-N(7))-methyltransferase RsmG [Peptoniphilus asaccharolyticus]SMB88084.1 16S rRNA (guanine527-N7)-methyltransferase [Peptoniphilus asaccharolyticus DSM 20463]